MTGSAWISTAEAARHLGVSGKTLISMARRCPPDLRAPFTSTGGLRPTYRWQAARLDEWATELGARQLAPHTRSSARAETK